MRSRRALLGTAAASAGLLAGCIGQLGSDGDGGSTEDDPKGPEDLEHFEQPRATILPSIVPEREDGANVYDVDVSGEPNEASHIEFRIDGKEEMTLRKGTRPTMLAVGVEEGTVIEAVAFYENGETQQIAERCVRC